MQLATNEHAALGATGQGALASATAAFVLVGAALPARATGDSLQLVPDFFFTSPILLVAFVLMIFPLNALIFKPILRVMEQRDDDIAGARRRAEQIQEQAQDALDRYEDSLRVVREEVMSDRRVSSDGARVELLATTRAAKEEAERELENARTELEGSLTEARATIREGSQDLAKLAAERILGRSIS